MILTKIFKQLFTHSKNIPKPSQILYKTDYYNSVHLTPTSHISLSQFKQYIDKVLKIQLQQNAKCNQQQQTNSIWVHLNPQNFQLAKYLCKNQFNIHHGIGHKLALCRWIAKKKDLITPYSNFYISAGAIIIKDQKILLVQQKNGPRKGDFGIPGGRADPGQAISSCSQRQLFQQTNIQAKFNYLLHFRELDKTANDAMDIYFACMMKFEQSALNNIKICQRQLNSYQWVHLSEYSDFCFRKSIGTQSQLAKYIGNLYKNGYDFKNRVPNQTFFYKYTSPRDKIERLVVQHGLVEGSKVEQIY